MITDKDLAKAAVEARNNSYSPYSGFMVGAALLTEEGKIYTGCNIENAAFSPTVCAERSAFFKAVSEGERSFAAIAVAGWLRGEDGPGGSPAFPCGVCRQVMMEFCEPDSFRVIITDSADGHKSYKLSEILPYGFGPKDLKA